MADIISSDPNSLSRNELIDQNLILRGKLNEIQMDHDSIWWLFVDISRRLQNSSASVKAAVTSLINHDIFWDVSTQFEFLQTIDHSVDDVSNLAMMVSLASRLRASKLNLRRETQLLQEILSVLDEDFRKRAKNIDLNIIFPAEGMPVYVDYEYLMIALGLLFEGIAVLDHTHYKIDVIAKETPADWVLEIQDIPSSIYNLVCEISNNFSEEFIKSEHISAEKALMIYNAYHIFRLQEIKLNACEDDKAAPVLRLVIPSK